MVSNNLNEINRCSERELALRTGLSRTTLRDLKSGKLNPTMSTLKKYASALGQEVQVLQFPTIPYVRSELSTVSACERVLRDGFESWKIHFFDFVDEIRRTRDSRLFVLPPVSNFDLKLTALLASICIAVSEELLLETPYWANEANRLDKPWFVSGIESLKASALLESPLAFKQKNIFVLDNFLKRL